MDESESEALSLYVFLVKGFVSLRGLEFGFGLRFQFYIY
jgi:hypothetical protein